MYIYVCIHTYANIAAVAESGSTYTEVRQTDFSYFRQVTLHVTAQLPPVRAVVFESYSSCVLRT